MAELSIQYLSIVLSMVWRNVCALGFLSCLDWHRIPSFSGALLSSFNCIEMYCRDTCSSAGLRDKDRDKDMENQNGCCAYIHAQNMTYLHTSDIKLQHADGNMHLIFFFLLRKSFFVSPKQESTIDIIQTSLGFNAKQWKGAQEMETDEKGGLVGQRRERMGRLLSIPTFSPKPPERLIRPAGAIRCAGKETVCSRNAFLRFYSHPY